MWERFYLFATAMDKRKLQWLRKCFYSGDLFNDITLELKGDMNRNSCEVEKVLYVGGAIIDTDKMILIWYYELSSKIENVLKNVKH